MADTNATAPTTVLHADALAAYRSYDAAIFAPVVYPLSFALLLQVLVYANILKHWRTGWPLLPACRSHSAKAALDAPPPRPNFLAVEAPTLLIMLSETIFGLCCIIQCATNFAQRHYVGGVAACELQGFYAAYYVFSSTALCAIAALAGAHVIRAVSHDGSVPPSSRSTAKAFVAAGIIAHVVAALVAALPLIMGDKDSGFTYMFAVDYCQHNVESTGYATLFLVWWLASFTVVVLAACRVARSSAEDRGAAAGATRMMLGIVAYFAFAWMPSVMLPLFHFGIGGAVASSPVGGIYGVQAIFLHTNQLAVPLLFGWRLREHMNGALAVQTRPDVASLSAAEQA